MNTVKLKRTALILLLLLITGVIVCSPIFAIGELRSNIVINRVDYVVENIHPLYWGPKTNVNTTAHLYINFFIYIDNLNRYINDIKEVKVYDASNSQPWTLNLKTRVNLASGYIGGYGRWYDDVMTNSSTLLSLNTYKVVIKTYNGETIEKPFTVCEPGQKDSTEKVYIYSETYRGKKDDTYVEALRLGKVESAEYKKGVFTIRFTINDDRAVNALVRFYDKKNEFLGESRWMINAFSQEIYSSVNDGAGFYTNGQVNTLKIQNNEIDVEKSKNITKAETVVLVVKDGKQFANTKDPNNFTHHSYSEPYEIKN